MRAENNMMNEDEVEIIQKECIRDNKFILFDETHKIAINIKKDHLDIWLDRYWTDDDREEFKAFLILNHFAFIGKVTIN
jgi:hypothetical protein